MGSFGEGGLSKGRQTGAAGMKYHLDFFTKKFKSMPEQIDILSLGTTAGHFAVDFSKTPGAVNFSLNVVLLNMYLPLLKKNENRIRRDAVIFMTMVYPIFLCRLDIPRRPEVDWQYAKVLFGRDPVVSVWKQCMLRLFPYFFVRAPLFRGMIRNGEINAWKNHKDMDEIRFYADYVVRNGWEKETGFSRIHDYEPGSLTQSEYDSMELNRNCVLELIRYCKERTWQPVLAGLPYSGVFHEMLPDAFPQDVFYGNLEQIQKETGVLFFDYSKDSEFRDINYYIDFWLMNDLGRKAFTKRLLRDMDDAVRAGDLRPPYSCISCGG